MFNIKMKDLNIYITEKLKLNKDSKTEEEKDYVWNFFYFDTNFLSEESYLEDNAYRIAKKKQENPLGWVGSLTVLKNIKPERVIIKGIPARYQDISMLTYIKDFLKDPKKAKEELIYLSKEEITEIIDKYCI